MERQVCVWVRVGDAAGGNGWRGCLQMRSTCPSESAPQRPLDPRQSVTCGPVSLLFSSMLSIDSLAFVDSQYQDGDTISYWESKFHRALILQNSTQRTNFSCISRTTIYLIRVILCKHLAAKAPPIPHAPTQAEPHRLRA